MIFFFIYLWTCGAFDRATSLISDTCRNLKLRLLKEEWVRCVEIVHNLEYDQGVPERNPKLRAGPTDTHTFINRSGSMRFTGCRLIDCYRRSKRSFWRERIESVHGWTKQSAASQSATPYQHSRILQHLDGGLSLGSSGSGIMSRILVCAVSNEMQSNA